MKRYLLLFGFLVFGAGLIFAAEPAWWSAPATQIRGTGAPADNYAPANLGQLKHVATQAKRYLDTQLAIVGGAGPTIDALVASFEPRSGRNYTTGQRAAVRAANYAPINLGQIKAVAKPFYDRLLAVGYDTRWNLLDHGYPATWAFNYPWNPATPVAENYAPANLGQLKLVFSFNLRRTRNPDGMDDWWKLAYFGSLEVDPAADSDGDGLTNAQEYAAGTNPNQTDTDNDGLSDSEEIALGADPLLPDSDHDDVNDGLDAYPLDRRRSEDLPVVRYVTIDISTPTIGRQTVQDVALNDSSEVGYLYGGYPASSIYSRTWKDGFVGNLVEFPISGGSPYPEANGSPTTGWKLSEISSTASTIFVSPTGAIASSAWEWEPDPDPQAPPNAMRYRTFNTIATTGGRPTPLHTGGWGSIEPWSISGFLGETLLWGLRNNSQHYVGGQSFPWGTTVPHFSPTHVSAAGKAAGSSGRFWDGSSVTFIKDRLGASSAEARAIGPTGILFGTALGLSGAVSIEGEAANAPHPFLLNGATGTDFFSLLPVKNRRQVEFEHVDYRREWMNSEGDLLTTAKLWQGPDQVEPWRYSTVLWRNAPHVLHEAIMPEGVTLLGFNKHDLLVGKQGKTVPLPPGTSGPPFQYEAAVLLLPMQVSYFTRRWENGAFEEQSSFLYESDPSPAIDLSVVSSTIDPETGNLTVVADCRVRDPLSETLSDQEYRLKEVKLLVNGAEVETVNLTGPPVGTAVDVWAPHPSERTIRRTFSVAAATVGAQIISAVTGINKAWRQGTAQIGVVVDEERDANGLPVQGANGTRLRIAATKPTTHSGPGFFDPYVVRVRTTASLTSWLTGPDAPELKLNGESVHLIERAALVNADPLPSGFKDFYLATGKSPQGADEQPKLFVIAEQNADDPIPGDTKTYTVTLEYGGLEQTLDERSLVRLPEALHMLASSVGGASSARGQSSVLAPGGHTPRYNENQVKFAFECIYGEPGIAILAAYQTAERRCSVLVQPMASIITGHYKEPNHMGTDGQGIDFIIDDDFYANAFEAAQGLWAEMRSVQGANSVANVALALQWEQFDNQTGDIARLYRAFRAGQLSEFADRLNTLTTTAKMGLMVLPYGGGLAAGLVFGASDAVDSLRDGNRGAAMFQGVFAVLPVAAAALANRELAVVIRASGREVTLLGGPTGEMGILSQAVRTASEKALINSTQWRVYLMRELRPFIEGTAVDGRRLSVETMKSLVKLGSFGRTPYPRKYASFGWDRRPYEVLGSGILERKGIVGGDWYKLARKNKPFSGYSPHHDLPHELEDQFLLAGLDPNDGFFFGRAVERTTHDEWHKVGGFGPGGPYNKLWRDFFARHPEGTKPTAAEIIEYLDELKKSSNQPIVVISIDRTKTAELYLSGWE